MKGLRTEAVIPPHGSKLYQTRVITHWPSAPLHAWSVSELSASPGFESVCFTILQPLAAIELVDRFKRLAETYPCPTPLSEINNQG
jgi:hypothetical protein